MNGSEDSLADQAAAVRHVHQGAGSRTYNEVPLVVTIDGRHRVIKTRGWGDISESDLLKTRERLATDPASDLSFARLCDLSEATSISVSDEMLDRWASDPIASPAVRHAVVCTAPGVMKRVLDYVARARRHLHDVSVFPTYDAAVRWVQAGVHAGGMSR